MKAIVAITAKSEAKQLQRSALAAFADALARRRTNLAAVLAQADDAERTQQIEAIFAAALTLAQDVEQSDLLRAEAVHLLAYHAAARPQLIELALHEPVQSVRAEVISALSRYGGKAPWKQLFEEFPGLSPSLRRAVVNAALGNSERTGLFLDAIAAGFVKAAEIDRSQVNRLLKHGNQKIQARAVKLLAAAVPEDRKKVLADYQVVLKMKADPQHGQQVFKKNCATCHKIGKVGVNVAPDISDSRTKKPAQILADVLQPNRAIDNNYVSYSVITADGKSLTGIITTDTASSITLKQAEGKVATLLRSEIDELRSNGISLMPEGLEKNIPHQDMADLISFIKNWRYLDGRTPLRERVAD